MSTWAKLNKAQRVEIVQQMRDEDPTLRYATIAKQLGTTSAAIGGVMFRSGASKLYDSPRPIADNVHPVVRTVFTAAKNAGMSEAELARRSGYAVETLWGLRTGVRAGKLRTLTDIAAVVGIEIVARPKE